MKTLINAYPPITDNIGFIEAPLGKIVKYCNGWFASHGRKPAELLNLDIDLVLRQLIAPLTNSRMFFVECGNGWTAIFQDSSDIHEFKVGHITGKLNCRGAIATFIEDTYERKSQTGTPGGVQLRRFERFKTQFLNRGRSISVINDLGRWRFDVSGEAMPFERTELYNVKRIKDRFPLELLIEYLGHLGIDAYSPDFYTDSVASYGPPTQ